MNRFLGSKRGSTSVMLLLLLVVLMIFGVLAFLSAYGNYRLGQSGQRWYFDTYALDSRGEELVAQVDGVLADAEAKARAQLCDPAATPDPALSLALSAGRYADPAALARALFPRVYLYYAAQGLAVLGMDASAATPDFALVYSEGLSSPESFLDLGTTLPEEPLALTGTLTSLDGRHILAIDCRVRVPAYTFNAMGSALLGVRQEGARYRIARWQQQQPPLTSGGADFDGTVSE